MTPWDILIPIVCDWPTHQEGFEEDSDEVAARESHGTVANSAEDWIWKDSDIQIED